MAEFTVTATLWRHHGAGGWHFVTLPGLLSDEIRARNQGGHRPFGSLPVMATIGATTWETSLFPDRAKDAYLLPVKTAVRKAERISDGDSIVATIDVGR